MYHIISSDGSTGRIISSDGTQQIGYWSLGGPTSQSTSRTETVSTQLVQGSQNRISQTSTSTPDLPNQMSSIITGVVVGAAGIAGMYAVKPSVKQFVNTATQKDSSDSKKLPEKSEVEFKYSSGTQSQPDVKIVDISAIIKQAAGPADTRVGPGEATFIQPDDSTTDTGSGSKESKPPETTIGPAPKDAIEKIIAQENKKPPTFKEMDESQQKRVDETATQVEGINTLFFGGPLYLAVNKFSKFGGLTLAGFQLFNKAILMTGQIPLENELTTNGDMVRASGHEFATLFTSLGLSVIPFVGPCLVLGDAAISATTGFSPIEETVRLVENSSKDTLIDAITPGFESEYNRRWDATAPEPKVLEDYTKKLEKSIQESEPGERRDKMQKVLKKVQEYKSEVAKRKNITEFNTKMFNSEFSSLEP